jgi:hypothetical protein
MVVMLRLMVHPETDSRHLENEGTVQLKRGDTVAISRPLDESVHTCNTATLR